MDPKFLEELQKLKEQKSADLNKIQDDLTQFNIPDFEDSQEEKEDEISEENATAGGTIKFEKVTDQIPIPHPPVPGGRRGRKPDADAVAEKAKKKKKKTLIAVFSSLASVVAVTVILLVVYFGVRNANMTKYSYPYWGMGVAIENGVSEYSFFGNLKSITRYGTIGQVEALAEFEKGTCVKETVFSPEGAVEYYYTHSYENGHRILSTYHRDGKMVSSVKYTLLADGTIQTETTYYEEENRVELSVITLNEDGNISSEDRYVEGKLFRRRVYSRTLVLEETYFDENQQVTYRTVYEYEGKLLKTQTDYDGTGAITTRTVNQYNDKNLLTKTIRYDGQGVIISYDTYNYDLNSNPIKQVSYGADGTMQQQILRVFNDKNRITKETALKADGTVLYCNGYDYDENGYVSKSIVYDNNNSNSIQEYTLFTRDEKGSITESNIYNSGNILIRKILYNQAGFISECYTFSNTGVLQQEEKYKYDEKQRQTEIDVTIYNEIGVKQSHYNELFNDQGFVTVRVEEDFVEKTYEQKLFQYHNDGWKLNEVAYDASGKKVHDRTFNEKEQVIKETICDDGKEALYFEYTYNEKNLVILRKTFDMLTNTLFNTVITYGPEDTVISEVDSDTENNLICKREYNEKGLIELQINYDEGGVADSYCKYEYDAQDRIIVEEVSDSENEIIQRTVYYYWTDGSFYYIIYDSDGNAIEDSRGPEFLGQSTPPNQPDDSENTEDTDDTDNTDVSETTDTQDN